MRKKAWPVPPAATRGCDYRDRPERRHVAVRALPRALLLVTGLVLIHAAHLWAPLTLIGFVFIVLFISRRRP